MLVVLSYFAFKMLFWMRKGNLEKSWKYTSSGAVILTFGVLLFSLIMFAPANIRMPLMWSGGIIMIVGPFLMLLGFRGQVRFWSGQDIQDERRNRIEP